MSAPGGVAWVDGELVPRERASVSIDDFGFRYGLTCFETMLARNGRVFRLAQHLDRLEASVQLFLATPPPRGELERAVAAALEANALTEASVRLSVTPGNGTRPALPATGTPHVIVTAEPLGALPARGRLWVSSVRLDAARPWRAAKVGQYATSLLARAEAEAQGYEDALLLDHAGRIAEAATANVFFEVDGAIVTPSLGTGALPGVTRGCVMEVAASLGRPVREVELTLADLPLATGAFVTSSIAGVAPVTSVAWDATGGRISWESSASAALVEIERAYADVVLTETR
ncbi:MAG: aminotransferase class IV [Dehalococcoidia bacterium]